MTTNLAEEINSVLLKMQHLSISSVFSTTFYRLATLMLRIGQQQVNQMEARHVFFEDVKDAMVANGRMVRSMNVETMRLQEVQTVHYPCAHVMVTCAEVSLNVEQFINDVYTLKHTLRVWDNEFPVLPDLSTWKVPPTTFELVPYKGLSRNPKGTII
ncbi:hypothetical protein GOBAR_DD12946 [Gossypium barbadense]|nr:hypothetical protein GOBAR_DD12946 [Gossypium barbadense]